MYICQIIYCKLFHHGVCLPLGSAACWDSKWGTSVRQHSITRIIKHDSQRLERSSSSSAVICISCVELSVELRTGKVEVDQTVFSLERAAWLES